MGRAFIVIICSLIFTLVLFVQVSAWSEDPPDWESLASQYRRLHADGKYELAEKLWYSKTQEMEQYIQTLSDSKQLIWNDFVAKDWQSSSYHPHQIEGMLTFLEVTSAENPSFILANRLASISTRAVSSTSIEDLERDWNLIRPVAAEYVDEEKMKKMDESMYELTVVDSMTGRETVSQQFSDLLKWESKQEWKAFFTVVLLVGGSVFITLLYVGSINYRKSSKNGHTMKSSHS